MTPAHARIVVEIVSGSMGEEALGKRRNERSLDDERMALETLTLALHDAISNMPMATQQKIIDLSAYRTAKE